MLCELLRNNGINAQMDLPATGQRQDWPVWMERQISRAKYVLVIASPAYKRRAEGTAARGEGRGARYEASLLREKYYADPVKWRPRLLPVLVPGMSVDDIPEFLQPYSASHYTVTELSLSGIEELLRVLTRQPAYPESPVGSVPRLPPIRPHTKILDKGRVDDGGRSAERRRQLVRRLASREAGRRDLDAYEDVRQLIVDELGVDESCVGGALQPGSAQRRHLCVDDVVVEVRKDLRLDTAARNAARDLVRHLADHVRHLEQRCVGVLTDGAEWQLYLSLGDEALPVGKLSIRPTDSLAADRLVSWLQEILVIGEDIKPTPDEVARRLGAGSPAYALDAAELGALYAKHHTLPMVDTKRALWARLLTTASGTNFSDDDRLFVDHTLLVVMAEIIAHSVVGIPLEASGVTAAVMLSGTRFAEARVAGVVEADFFDWVAHVPGGEQLVQGMARRLARFAWSDVDHDVMKILYESIIGAEMRHRLGEYYTPDWLAGEIVAVSVASPLDQRVLDASCGSGTFLFHAVRRYLTAADAAEMTNPQAIQGLVKHVMGIDVHPVAVTLARVTYLLAIGMHRLSAGDRPAFSVPVYLGDSLQWGQEKTLWSHEGLDILTDSDHEAWVGPQDIATEAGQLRFPDRLLADTEHFDELVTMLADQATQREPGSTPPSLAPVFDRLGIHQDDRDVLTRTFRRMCDLHDQGRDHIWGYYIRNVARPVWLARRDNRVDVVVGNPPWLAYRYMTGPQQASFRAMSVERKLWAGATVATNQDLSALFVTRCIELYLRPGGWFHFVMPLATLSRRQYGGFRSGHIPTPQETIHIVFEQPWDLHRVKPAFFPVPPCVVSGRRGTGRDRTKDLDQIPEIWSGRLPKPATRSDIAKHIARAVGEPAPTEQRSAYAERFSQGATIVPRLLFLVERDSSNPLGAGAGRQAVRSKRSRNEKKPWKELPTLGGTVEQQFIRPLYVGESIMPFRCLQPAEAVIPWDGKQLLGGEAEQLAQYPGLEAWWQTAERLWIKHRTSPRLSLLEQLDYRGKLTQQIPVPEYRVVYGASGMYMAGAVIVDATAFIEHGLYWGPASTLDEARFLTAILNSNVLSAAVQPLQGRGEHNPRHFDKYVFRLPIPIFDPADATHELLVTLAQRAERVAADVELPSKRFEAKRGHVRDALKEDGVGAEIDAIVKTLLA